MAEQRSVTSPIFLNPSQAWALIVEHGQAWAWQNIPQACFEPKLFTNKNTKIWVQAYFQPFVKLGSSSLELGAYLLQAKISTRAFEPEPRLVPPLVARGSWNFCSMVRSLTGDWGRRFENQELLFRFRFVLGEPGDVSGRATGFPGADVVHAAMVVSGEYHSRLDQLHHVDRKLAERMIVALLIWSVLLGNVSDHSIGCFFVIFLSPDPSNVAYLRRRLQQG